MRSADCRADTYFLEMGKIASGIRVGTRDDVHGDNLADPGRSGSTGVDSGLAGGDVAPDQGGDQTAADPFKPDQFHPRGFGHGIGGLDQRGHSLGFDYSQCVHDDSP